MAIPLPTLDDRKWIDLVQEARALVPRYASEWTDHNVHDPGITLIELLGSRTEMSLYRLNHISQRHLLKFLALAGITPRGPIPAAATISIGPLAAGTSFDLPQGTQFASLDMDGQPVPFSTTRELHLAPVTLAALLTVDGAGNWRRLADEMQAGHAITVMGVPSAVGAAVYWGFSQLPAGVPVSMGLWFDGAGHHATERARVFQEAKEQRETCRPMNPGFICKDAEATRGTPMFLPPHHHSVRLIWEISTAGATWTELQQISMPARPAAGQIVDDTRSLTLNGIVEFFAPANIAPLAVGGNPTPLVYLRARLSKGAYDAPVVLRAAKPNSTYVQQSVPLWQTIVIRRSVVPVNPPPTAGALTSLSFTSNLDAEITALTFLAAGTGGAPSFRMLAHTPPAGGIAGSLTLELFTLGHGTAVPLQQVSILDALVEAEGLHVFTHQAGTWTTWTKRDDFDASTKTDHHFTLQPTLGAITFGDGDQGETAPANALMIASGTHTLADQGNSKANTIRSLANSPQNQTLLAGLSAADMLQLRQKTTNPFAAMGGEPEQTLETLVYRAVAAMDAHNRITDLVEAYGQETLDQIPSQATLEIQAPGNAVTVADLERIAFDTPGTRIARVRAWRNHHALLPCLHASGFVTVVVIPDMPVPRPLPSAGLIEAVRRYLDRRRIVCTQVVVTGPKYVEIRVLASVTLKTGASSTRVLAAIKSAIDDFLDARIGGPQGRGWPFGRSIYRSEMLQLIDDIPGVDHVVSLTMTADSSTPQCGDIRLCNTWLPSHGAHKLEIA